MSSRTVDRWSLGDEGGHVVGEGHEVGVGQAGIEAVDEGERAEGAALSARSISSAWARG